MLIEGDRVSRQIEIGKPERKFGVIVKKYKSRQASTHTPYTLYDVRWDNDPTTISHGHIESGLQKEAKQ